MPRATREPKNPRITGRLEVRTEVTSAVELAIAVVITSSIETNLK